MSSPAPRHFARGCLASLALAAFLVVSAAAAQPEVAEPATTQSTAEPQTTGATAPAAPRVTAVSYAPRAKGRPGPLLVSDRLVIEVAGLRAWLDKAAESCWDLRLFLDERAIEALQPSDCDLANQRVSFELYRIDRGQEAAWQSVLAKRRNFTAEVDISVGLATAGAKPIASDAEDIELVLVEIRQATAALIALLGSLGLFLYLMKRSNIVRDGGPEPPAGHRRTYSLARMQSAFWFFLILWGYLLISILVSSNVDIPSSCLWLMGIAAGTFVGAEVIDNGKRNPASASTGTGSAPVGQPSQGLIRDLLSDSTGVAFHRFQMMVWTVVLGGVFAIQVWNQLAMPDFDSTLLGLMGVSSGTYLGLKLPEESS
jgi:hypothetical protein